MAEAKKDPAADPLLGRLRAVVDGLAPSLRKFLREITEAKKADTSALDFSERPTGWFGHWSVRYGKLLARTINLYPPFTEAQSESLSGIPQPMREALDPVASTSEPMDRNGKPLGWRLTRSAVFDLAGPIGLAVGGLAVVIVALTVAAPLLKLPPLMAPKQELQPSQTPQRQQQEQQQQQQEEQQQQQQQQGLQQK